MCLDCAGIIECLCFAVRKHPFISMNSRASHYLSRLCCSKLLPWLILLVGLLTTCVAHHAAMENAHRLLRENFNYRTREIASRIDQGIAAYKMALHGASGVLARRDSAGRKEFSDYLQRLIQAKKFPGALAMGYMRMVVSESAEQQLQAQPDYVDCFVPADATVGLRRTSFGALASGSRQCQLGRNFHLDQASRLAMQQARDQNRVFMSGRLTIALVPATVSQQAYAMYFPVYRGGGENRTLSERRANISGWVFIVFRLDDLLHGQLGEYGGELALAVDAGEDIPAAQVRPTLLSVATPLFEAARRLDLAGQPLQLKISSLPEFESRLETGVAETLKISGILVSAVLFLYVWSLVSGRESAVALANVMTRDLQDSENRWKFAVEGSGDALWDWSVKDGTMLFSSRWKEMLGFDEDEIGSGFGEWEQRIHPDDRQHTAAAIASLIGGCKASYQSEHRLKCRNGEWKWVLDRGMVVQRDGNGNPLRVIGTLSDIDDRKAAESRIRRLTQLYAALSHCNQAIVRAVDETELFADICRIAVEFGGMKMAWIGLIDDTGQHVRVAASCGMSQEYLDEMRFLVEVAGQQYQVNSDEAASKLQLIFNHRQWPLWCQDVQSEPLLEQWRERAQVYGWSALGALPLLRKGRLVGAFLIYASEVNAFDQEARDLLEEMAMDISSALDNFEREDERRKAEQALRDSETFNVTVLDSLGEHIAVIDAQSNIVTVNRAWLQFARDNGTPDSMEYWRGANYFEQCEKMLHQENASTAAVARAGIKAVLTGGQPSFEMEYSCRSPYWQRWFVMHVTPLGDANPGAVVAHEDITRRKKGELEINNARIRLAELSSQLIEAQESERKNLARELHDELGQRFTTLSLGLHRMQKYLATHEARDAWHMANEEVASLIQRVRVMSRSLRPPMLDHLGLEASVRQLLQQNFSDGGYVFEYVGLPQKLPAPVEITAFRLIQEGITNITRHAQASHVIVEINGGEFGDELEIIIRDNGCGFEMDQMQMAAHRGSFGLVGMRERVTMLGGKFRVDSAPGQGTRIEVQLKL